jgi:acetoin utilization protein AcuB
MFSIYGITGQTFRGTLERMIQVPGVTPALHARAINREAEEIGVEAVAPRPREAAATPAQEHAVEAYRSMLPRELERGPLYHASQVMQAPVITARADDPVEHVWNMLAEHGIRQVPILDPAHRLVGILNDRDLLAVLNVEQGQVRDVLARTAADVMRTPVIAADPVTDIRRVARVMLEYRQSGVPILDDSGSLIGFISQGDILRAVVTEPPLSLWV